MSTMSKYMQTLEKTIQTNEIRLKLARETEKKLLSIVTATASVIASKRERESETEMISHKKIDLHNKYLVLKNDSV